jgi:sterol desaturase/sphingolipid hydroxylase (fatty acid hydroxylase superfamily)
MSSETRRDRGGDDRTAHAFRQTMLDAVPRWYSPWGHLAGTVGIGISALALSIWRIEGLRSVELWTIPCVFVLANLVEWYVHKNVMHRRWRPMVMLYQRHTPEHHRVFRYDDMAIHSPRELRLVLIPAIGVLGIVLMAATPAILLGLLVSSNVGWLWVMTAALYVVGYELTHLCYHLPERSIIYRIPFMRFLREHHARHHAPSLMRRWNFNVTIPVGDLVFRTVAPPELVAKATNQRHEADI